MRAYNSNELCYQEKIKNLQPCSHSQEPNSLPNLVEHLHEGVVDHERDGHVEADPAQPGQRALVEGHGALVLPNLDSAVDRRLVLARLQPLHPGLDDVDGRVAKDGGGAGDGAERARDELVDRLVGVPAAPPVLERLHDEEADGLVRALLRHRREEALVRPADTFQKEIINRVKLSITH